MLMKNLIQTTLCVAAILMPFSLLAQDSDAIEEVIVTATKTEANAQDVPIGCRGFNMQRKLKI
jgi:outer membrane cobalamin receptor